MAIRRLRATRATAITIVVVVVSALYVGAIFWLYSKYTNPGEYLDYNNWNAFGDFLAGFFAPLAFFWLVAAVYIQRQDIKETQAQYEASQEQLLRSQELVGEQMQFISLQNKNAELVAERSYKLSLFEPRLDIYKQLLGIDVMRIIEPNVSLYVAKRLEDIKYRAKFLFGNDIDAWLDKIIKTLWALYAATMTRQGVTMDIDDIVLEGEIGPDKDMAAFDAQISSHISFILNALSETTINRNLLPYLKVYED